MNKFIMIYYLRKQKAKMTQCQQWLTITEELLREMEIKNLGEIR